MTPEEVAQNMNKVAFSIERAFGDIMKRAAFNALATLRNRVQTSGVNAEGSKFPPYSTRPMLTNCASMTQAACAAKTGNEDKRKKLKWVTLQRGGRSVRLFELEGGYAEYRDLHGRQTSFVDFTFSGKMWANISLVSSDEEHQKGVARITAPNEDEYKKLEGNTNRKGTILDLNPAEVQDIADIISREFEGIWKVNKFA